MTTLWKDTLSLLNTQMTNATYETWLRVSAGTVENDILTVAVPNTRARDVLDHRLRTTIERAITQISDHPLEVIFTVDKKLTISHPKPDNGNNQQQPYIRPENFFDLFSANHILVTNWPEPAWIIPNCLPEGLSILAGKPKIGKSWLALQMARAVSTGQSIIGQQIEQGPVLYLALEDPPRRLKERMSLQKWPDNAQADFMVMGTFQSQIGDLGRGGGEILAQQIRLKKYRLVIIDTFSRAIGGDQKDSETMTAALDPIQEIAHDCHCAAMIIDHHPKVKALTPDVILDIFGSVAKGAMVDTAWGLYRQPGILGATLAITGREVNEQMLRLTMDWDHGLWQAEVNNDGFQMTPRRQEIFDALNALGRSQVGDISRAIDQDRGNTYKRLQDLVNANLAQKIEDNNGHIFYEAISQPEQTLH